MTNQAVTLRAAYVTDLALLPSPPHCFHFTKHRYRAKHNAPALAWDTKLAAVAQAWADSCPWGLSDQPYGENMAWGYNGFADAMEAWYSEVCAQHDLFATA